MENQIHLISAANQSILHKVRNMSDASNTNQVYFQPEDNRTPMMQWVFGCDLHMFKNHTGVYVYTFSEYIFAGIRLSVKRGKLDPERLTITYYDEDSRIYRINMDEDGDIDKWPDGFMDTFEMALMQLL